MSSITAHSRKISEIDCSREELEVINTLITFINHHDGTADPIDLSSHVSPCCLHERTPSDCKYLLGQQDRASLDSDYIVNLQEISFSSHGSLVEVPQIAMNILLVRYGYMNRRVTFVVVRW